jgi:phosphohistidine swiveling domain-containing protein
MPCIVRSISPTEDTQEGSEAGRFLSLVVGSPGDFPGAVARVVASLPVRDGRRLGAVAVQPYLVNPRAGVTFFDGFYFEESELEGQNGDATSGRRRGKVRRGQVQRGDSRSDWLLRIHGLLRGAIDVEWTEKPDGERILLQARLALFPVRRNQTLSVANHRETLGNLPSPWIVGVYAEVGNPVLELARRADPSLPDWDEHYAVCLAGRAWVNFSALFRLMDRWGLPRSLVSRSLGGQAPGPLDERFLPGPFVRALGSLAAMACLCLLADLRAPRDLRRLGALVDSAPSLLELWDANVRIQRASIRQSSALIAIASTLASIRRRLGLSSHAEIITRAMMEDYAEIAARPRYVERIRGLDAWLERYGHRGPRETDPAQPRFSELRGMLARDLAVPRLPDREVPPPGPPGRHLFARLFCHWEERREWFRDAWMSLTQRLRTRILGLAERAVEAGHLDRQEDVFFLTRCDLTADPATWRSRVAITRLRYQRERSLDLPTTATRDEIERLVSSIPEPDTQPGRDQFRGVGVGTDVVTGTVVRPVTIDEVLRRRSWPDPAVLVVHALEPSWGVVYPRFSAVVSQLGGELSHAAILLREANLTGVINASGAYHELLEGDTVRVDPLRGEVVRLSAGECCPGPCPPSIGFRIDTAPSSARP